MHVYIYISSHGMFQSRFIRNSLATPVLISLAYRRGSNLQWNSGHSASIIRKWVTCPLFALISFSRWCSEYLELERILTRTDYLIVNLWENFECEWLYIYFFLITTNITDWLFFPFSPQINRSFISYFEKVEKLISSEYL